MDNKMIVGLYYRLSEEDEEIEYSASMSIVGQQMLLQDFVKNHNELSACHIMEFKDDGYSGTNFDRPGIQELLSLVKNGMISCIIVKDFSRFGRNYIEVGNYLEQVFPFMGIRFISVNDGYDSQNVNAVGNMDTAFKNLIYDFYSKDLSQKITSVRRTKAAQGKFITCYAPYGFKKSSNQRLVKDEESSEVVKRIFQMTLDGISRAEITRIFNKEGILSPMMLRKQRKDNFPNYHVNEQCHWTLSVICKMLKDRRYVGDAVYGKIVPSAAGSRKDVPVPEEEWIVVPEAHEAIISREEFDKVQAIFKTHNYSRRKETSPFARKIKCAVCNHTMPNQRKNSVKRGLQSTFRCNTSLSKPEYSCFTGTLFEKKLEEIVVNQLNWYASLAWDEKLKTVEERKREEQDNLREEITCLTKQLQVRKVAGLAEYEALKEGHISKESFLKKRVTLEQEAECIMESIKEKERLVIELDIKKEQVNENEFLLKQYNPFEKLTKTIVDVFIEMIYVEREGTLRIKWKFSDEFLNNHENF